MSSSLLRNRQDAKTPRLIEEHLPLDRPTLPLPHSSRREHFRQHSQHVHLGLVLNAAKPAHQARFIYGAHLVQHDLTVLPFEAALYAGWVEPAARGHGGDYDRADAVVHFVGGYDKTRARLLNLAPHGRVE